MDASDFLRYSLEPARLAVLGAVAARSATLPDLTSATEQSERAVLSALAPLLQAGIVVQDGKHFTLRQEALRDLARDLPQPEPAAATLLLGMTQDEQDVIRRFFRGDSLVEVPSAHGKRRVVLERLALEFEPGVHYAEQQVNEILTRFHDDYAALRRYLVDEGFLDRAEGVYWRSGGRVE